MAYSRGPTSASRSRKPAFVPAPPTEPEATGERISRQYHSEDENEPLSLAEELAGTGVTVTTLCPGTTRTEFFARAHFSPRRNPLIMDADKVARIGYRGLMQGKRVVIPGMLNRIVSAVAKRMPARLTSGFVRRLHKHQNSPGKT